VEAGGGRGLRAERGEVGRSRSNDAEGDGEEEIALYDCNDLNDDMYLAVLLTRER
jgi:hypothetical protein